MKETLIILLCVLFIVQSLPVSDHDNHVEIRRSKRHSIDRHSIADKEVRTIISAIVDAILDGDRKKRSYIPEDDDNTADENDEEDDFQDDLNKFSENSESEEGAHTVEHSSILEESADNSAKISKDANSVSRSAINKVVTANSELLTNVKNSTEIDKQSYSGLNSESESGSTEQSGYDSGSSQDQPEEELFSITSKSLVTKGLDASRMKRDEDEQLRPERYEDHINFKNTESLVNKAHTDDSKNLSVKVNKSEEINVISGDESGSESGTFSGEDLDSESGITSEITEKYKEKNTTKKSEKVIEKSDLIFEKDKIPSKVTKSLKSENMSDLGSGDSSAEESSSDENIVNKRSTINVEENFNDNKNKRNIHHTTFANNSIDSKILTKRNKVASPTLIKNNEELQVSGGEIESGSGSLWDGSSEYGLGSGGEKRGKVFLKADKGEIIGDTVDYFSGSGSGSGSGSSVSSAETKANISFELLSSVNNRTFDVRQAKDNLSHDSLINNTNILNVLSLVQNKSDVKVNESLNEVLKNRTLKSEALKNENLNIENNKNETFTHAEDKEEKDEEDDYNKSVNQSINSISKVSQNISNNSNKSYTSNEDNGSSSGDENSYTITEQSIKKVRNNTTIKNKDNKELLMSVVTDMAKAADESIQVDDSDSVVKKSKIHFPEGKNLIVKNKIDKDKKESLPVDLVLKNLVLNILKEDPSLKSSLSELVQKRKVEERKLQDQILSLVSHEHLNKQNDEEMEEKVTSEIKDFEGLVETLSQTESLTPIQHEMISRKLEKDLLNHLSIPENPELLQQESELLKSSEMEFVKDKIEEARENTIEYATKHSGNMEDIRKFATTALKPIVESLPLKKEDIEGLAKSISKSAWVKMITHMKLNPEIKSKVKRSLFKLLNLS